MQPQPEDNQNEYSLSNDPSLSGEEYSLLDALRDSQSVISIGAAQDRNGEPILTVRIYNLSSRRAGWKEYHRV